MTVSPDPYKDDAYKAVCTEIWDAIKEEKSTLIFGTIFMLFVFGVTFFVSRCVD